MPGLRSLDGRSLVADAGAAGDRGAVASGDCGGWPDGDCRSGLCAVPRGRDDLVVLVLWGGLCRAVLAWAGPHGRTGAGRTFYLACRMDGNINVIS